MVADLLTEPPTVPIFDEDLAPTFNEFVLPASGDEPVLKSVAARHVIARPVAVEEASQHDATLLGPHLLPADLTEATEEPDTAIQPDPPVRTGQSQRDGIALPTADNLSKEAGNIP